MWLKLKKDQEQYEKTIIELKGRAAKFYKSHITFWAKAVLQKKNKHKFAASTQSMDITDLAQSAFTCSKLTIKTLQQGMKCV